MNTLPVQVVDKLQKIRLILLDVDGVLTDGRIGMLPGGEEIKFFSVYDGLAIRLAMKVGWEVGFLSGRTSEEVAARARELGIEIVVQGSRDKVADFEKILKDRNLKASEVAYMGDDLPDLSAIEAAGLGLTVADGADPVRAAAQWCSTRRGGDGAVREACEFILQTKEKLAELEMNYR